MQTQNTQAPPKDFWENVRDNLVSGMRELRDRGDDLARQGRLRMDLVQAQRRLRQAYEALGEAAYSHLTTESSVDAKDPKYVELCERVRYYSDEVRRLQNELKRDPVRPG